MDCFAGVDIGSMAIKAVLVDADEQVLGRELCATGSRFNQNADEALGRLLEGAGVRRQDVRYLVATGYGRRIFTAANDCVSEITANGVGACGDRKNPTGVRTIINLGGQDTKIISVDDRGQVMKFKMNDKCAAGTGRFLDMTALTMGISLEEMGAAHRGGGEPRLSINSTCTVFAESEITSLLADGKSREDVITAVHLAIARRISRLASDVQISDKVLFDGGPALNRGLVRAMSDVMRRELVVAPAPQFTTAYGAALLARRRAAGGGTSGEDGANGRGARGGDGR
jgi:(R)-2-hydroxyacyl-CoA dehydratese activating ATPase